MADFAVNCQRNVSFKATVLSVTLKKISISAKFTDVTCNLSNNNPRISGKMGLTVEDKILIINNQLIDIRFLER
jgi:hypothetical protein